MNVVGFMNSIEKSRRVHAAGSPTRQYRSTLTQERTTQFDMDQPSCGSYRLTADMVDLVVEQSKRTPPRSGSEIEECLTREARMAGP